MFSLTFFRDVGCQARGELGCLVWHDTEVLVRCPILLGSLMECAATCNDLDLSLIVYCYCMMCRVI
jgi:hypothetical protein